MAYFSSVLPNGLKVVTAPMRERDSAAVAIWVKTGGRYESKKLSGCSHYLEHMLFKGTRKRTTRQIKEEIEGVGGMLNAFTGEEVTCYFAKILHEHYDKALDVLSDMVNHATIDAEELRKERTVILEEIKMYRDLPSHLVQEVMGEMLWPEQPLGRPIAGTLESVAALSRKQIVDYMKSYYHPKNILVSVAGPVRHDEVVLRTREFFHQPSRRPASQFKRAVRRQRRPETLFIEKETEQTHFVIGFHGISRFDADRYKLGILNVILGANMSSRLFEEVRERRGLAYEIRSGLSYYQDTGSVTVAAGVECKKAAQAIHVILRELEKICKKGVTAGELRRAKDYYMSQLYMALEDTLEHILWVGERAIDDGKLPDREDLRRKIEAVALADIQEVARRIFRNASLNLALIGPVTDKNKKKIGNCFELEVK